MVYGNPSKLSPRARSLRLSDQVKYDEKVHTAYESTGILRHRTPLFERTGLRTIRLFSAEQSVNNDKDMRIRYQRAICRWKYIVNFLRIQSSLRRNYLSNWENVHKYDRHIHILALGVKRALTAFYDQTELEKRLLLK